MSASPSARTYNQEHIPRRYTKGKRRFSNYSTWSYPWESQPDPAAMEPGSKTKVNVTLKFFDEFADRSTFEGIPSKSPARLVFRSSGRSTVGFSVYFHLRIGEERVASVGVGLRDACHVGEPALIATWHRDSSKKA